jgi:hypothetical protein
VRGLYLWPSLLDRKMVESTTGRFFVMIATTVTNEEDALAQETSPPHLLLLLKRLGIGQASDPMRRSAGEHASFDAAWREIRGLSHADAVRQLNLRGDK